MRLVHVMFVQSNASGSASARVVNTSQSNDNTVDPAVTSAGTDVHDSSVPMPLILPPSTSVEADERTSVSSADYVIEVRCSSSTLPTREPQSVGAPPYSTSKDRLKLDSTVDSSHTNTAHRLIVRLQLDYQSLYSLS